MFLAQTPETLDISQEIKVIKMSSMTSGQHLSMEAGCLESQTWLEG